MRWYGMSRSLDASFNALTGSLSDSVSAMTNLQLLQLSGNHLTGTIPKAAYLLGKLTCVSRDCTVMVTGK